MKVCVILPGYNEEKYIHKVLRKVKKFSKYIVYVDDGSSDRSVQIAKKTTPYVVIHETNLGKGAAMKTGADFAFKKLHANAIIFMDSDNQHDPKEIPQFIRLLNKNKNIVFGVRKFSSEMPLMRMLGNKFASIMMNIIFHTYIPDIPSGFKAMTKEVYEKVRWKSTGYEVEAEIAVRVSRNHIPFSTLEIESIYHDAEKGMTAIDAIHIAKSLIQWKIGL